MRFRHSLIALAMLPLFAQMAYAVEQGGVSDTTTAATITVTSGNCLAANGYRRSLVLDASAAAANIGYCEAAGGVATCTAAIGTAGTTTIPAASSPYWWPAGAAPQNALCFIAASGSQPLTIREGY